MPQRKLLSTTPHHVHHDHLSFLALIGIAAIGLGFLIVVVFFVYLYYKRLKSSKTSPYDLTGVRLQKYSYRELKRATSSFSSSMKLGKGGFGVVYKGVLRNGKEVAIKRLDVSSMQSEREFQNELFIVGRLRSPFIVRLLGYCVDGRRRLLVFEHMANGSLQDALFDKGELLDWQKRFKIVLDVAHALAFLHLECDPPIIHGDVKPSNVLLGPCFSAHLADFGLARLKGEDCHLGHEFACSDDEKMKANKQPREPSFRRESSSKIDDAILDIVDSKGKEISDTQSLGLGESGKLGHMFEVEDLCTKYSPSHDGRKSWTWMSGEISAKDYVKDWIDGGKHKKKKKRKRGCQNSEVVHCGETMKKIVKKENSPKEWWKEEYFEEMKGKKKKNKKNGQCPKSFDEHLEALRGFQRRKSFGMMSTCKRDKGEMSFRSRRDSISTNDMCSGDLLNRGDMSSTTSMRGTVCYVPPEYRGCGLQSEKGDIYSFGVLMLVILSGRRPLHVQASPMKNFERANLVSWARQLAQAGNMLELVSESLCGNYDKKQAELCITLALLCLQRVPELRPTISDVLQILKGKMELPCLPFEFSPSPQSKMYRKSKKKNTSSHVT